MKVLSHLFQPVNILGLIIYLPVFMATAMSTDAIGSKNLHWAHELFMMTNLALGPLCLVGTMSSKCRYLGAIGFAAAAVGWFALITVCDGEFRCGR